MNFKYPLVSIGIPVYNGEQFLRDALNSALAQTYPEIEIIICDNASTDGTETIAREYAGSDSRIRYWRNSENLGVVRNFGETLSHARGRYFTWLACDDLLSDVQYTSTAVAFLEANPHIVLCGCEFHLLHLGGPGRQTSWTFPQIYPDRDEREVRRIFYSWPQDPACFAIYGMFRREALQGISFMGRTYRGQPVATHMEYFILVPVLAQGRIAAIPGFMRTYRRNESSAWHREAMRLSGLDEFLLGLQIKTFLLWQALTFPGTPQDKVQLTALAVGNFLRFGLRTRRGEVRRLRMVATERAKLILILRVEIEKRWAAIVEAGLTADTPSHRSDVTDDNFPCEGAGVTWLDRNLPAWLEPMRDWIEWVLTDFSRAPSPARQVDRVREAQEIFVLRELCEERLAEIIRLDAEAERYLELMQSTTPGKPDSANAAI